MKLLMISGDRSILQGKKGAFYYMLQEFSRHWDRVDIIVPRTKTPAFVRLGGLRTGRQDLRLPPSSASADYGRAGKTQDFPNVFFHPTPHGLWYQPWWILKKGSELISEFHHDVMTVHEYPPFYNGIGAKWLHKKTKMPYALEIHHIVGFPKAASMTEVIGRILSRKFLWLDSWHAAAVRVVNASVKERLMQWAVPERKISIVPSAYLDRNLLKPDATIQKKYDVVCSGRLVANKGIANVIDAVAMLPGITLCIIGDGPERVSLERRARRIRDRVTFAGWLSSQEEVMHMMQSAHVFVMNSKSEGGPRVALEAMALGMPVIATRVGVMPDVIRDGENGIFTTSKPSDLSEKMRRLLSNTGERERIGREAQKIIDRFDKNTLIKNYADFLKSAAARYGRS